MHRGPPLYSRLLIAIAVFRVTATGGGAAAVGCGEGHRRHGLRPRFLNGHYIAWPPRRRCGATRSGDTRRTGGRDEDCVDGGRVNGPADVRPPPYVYYAPDNVVFTRMQMAGDRAFVVSPRYKPGVPFTLGYVPLTDCAASAGGDTDSVRNRGRRGGFQSVSPYPSLRAHCQFPTKSRGYPASQCDTDGLVNVVDAYLGPDGVLWVLDVGVVNTLQTSDANGKTAKYNEPRVLGIDVATGNTVHKIALKTMLAPVREDYSVEKQTATLAQRMHTIAVEYEYDGDDESAIGTGSDNGSRKKSDEPPSHNKLENGTDSNSSDNGNTNNSTTYSGNDNSTVDSGSGNSDNSSDDTSNTIVERLTGQLRRVARPVAVYVGDATGDRTGSGSILVWFVEDGRGIRVTFPPSVSATDDCVDDDGGDLDVDALHMALLDEPGTGGGRRRYLYFTYGRHPDAFKIPVSVFRDRRRRTADRPELRLTNCHNLLQLVGGGGNRCVTNVGRKPTEAGRGGRPLIPVDSAYGFLWYFRDHAVRPASGRDALYVWDSRRPFHWEQFEPVRSRGRTSSSGICDGCSDDAKTAAEAADIDRPPNTTTADGTKTEKEGDAVGGKGNEKDDDYDDEDGERCESCAGGNRTTGPGHPARFRRGIPSSSGCLQVTSVDHVCPVTAVPVAGGLPGALWALHTNVRDWLRGRTGRFGTTALLCPV